MGYEGLPRRRAFGYIGHFQPGGCPGARLKVDAISRQALDCRPGIVLLVGQQPRQSVAYDVSYRNDLPAPEFNFAIRHTHVLLGIFAIDKREAALDRDRPRGHVHGYKFHFSRVLAPQRYASRSRCRCLKSRKSFLRVGVAERRRPLVEIDRL